MTAVFVDTWFFVAHLHRFDSDHAAAMRIARAHHDTLFVTHDAVLTELLTFFSGHGSFWRNSASALVRKAMASRKYQVTPQSRHFFENALDLYERRQDKEYSLVDCMSMILMQRRDITHVLTNDHHFRQEGFTVVSDAQ